MSSKTHKIYTCSVTNCRQYREAHRWPEPLSFHEFPSDLARRQLWLKAIGREGWIPRDKAKVCSVHFTSVDYRETGVKNRKLLKQTAVPSLHLNLKELVQESSSDEDWASNLKEISDEETSSDSTAASRKRMPNIIVVDLIKDKRMKYSETVEPESTEELCDTCLEMKKELREVKLELAFVKKELEEQKKIVDDLKKKLQT